MFMKSYCWTFVRFQPCTTEGFHVTSYQANFASHHTRNRHVGFFFTWSDIGKYNKMSRYFLFSSVHTIIPNYNWVTRILANTLSWNFYSFYEVSKKFKRFFFLFFFFCIPRHTKRKPSFGAKSCTNWCVLCCSNPLYDSNILRIFLNNYEDPCNSIGSAHLRPWFYVGSALFPRFCFWCFIILLLKISVLH